MAKNKKLDICSKRELFCECEQCAKYWEEFDLLVEDLELDVEDDVKNIRQKYKKKCKKTISSRVQEDYDDESLADLAKHHNLDGWGI